MFFSAKDATSLTCGSRYLGYLTAGGKQVEAVKEGTGWARARDKLRRLNEEKDARLASNASDVTDNVKMGHTPGEKQAHGQGRIKQRRAGGNPGTARG